MATTTTTATQLQCSNIACHSETPALTRLKQLQAQQLPCIVRMSPSPSIRARGRAFQKRRARQPGKSSISPPKSPKLLQPAHSSQLKCLATHPPYIPIPGVRRDQLKFPSIIEFVEGATCRLILQLVGEGKSWTGIIDHLHRTCLEPDQSSRFDIDGIRAIAGRCRLLGLTAYTQLESEDWDPEDIEKWWIKEDRRRYDSLVGEDICGSTGWWNKVSLLRCTLCLLLTRRKARKQMA